MSIEADAKTIVQILRAQYRGTLVINEADALQLIVDSLTIAEQRGYIDGVNRMGEIADKTLAPVAEFAS
jgi:hypothetical protein